MHSPKLSVEPLASQVEETAKHIKDLDLLIRALLTSLPAAKPWQRQLRGYLADADRLVQVLRLTIAMDCDRAEVAEAATAISSCLRTANTYVCAGRADMGTKNAVQLGFSMSQRIVAGLGS